MAKVWSFNTTVRNPERIQEFLLLLKNFEGKEFDEECQRKFFAAQIKKRLYRPTMRTLKDVNLLKVIEKDSAEEIPEDILQKIIKIYESKEVGPEARGRTTAGILNRFGLAVASKSRGKVAITILGRNWLDGKISDQELFTRFLLKWQYPNPLEKGYSSFNIKPFIGTLHLINEINKKSKKLNKSTGISREEFLLFVPSLSDYKGINKTVNEIFELRAKLNSKSGNERKEFFNLCIKERLEKIFGKNLDLREKYSNLHDYTDSAIRYFRMTEFIYLKGSNNYIDLNPNHEIEIEKLLEKDNASALNFQKLEKYLKYLVDIKLPDLPWYNNKDLKNIKINLIKRIIELAKGQILEENIRNEIDKIEGAKKPLDETIISLEALKNRYAVKQLMRYKYDSDKMEECISSIKDLFTLRPKILTTRPSLDLEWYSSISLMILNDADDIIPSYKLGDDGIPTGFVSGKTDIECYYPSFNMIVEVTMLRGRDQYIKESQPVMRHLRDFENKLKDSKETYGIFIAPSIHRDTLGAFWPSIKWGYESQGKKQKIIPLTINQLIDLLTFSKKRMLAKKPLRNKDYLLLFSQIIKLAEKENDSSDWMSSFDKIISTWVSSIK